MSAVPPIATQMPLCRDMTLRANNKRFRGKSPRLYSIIFMETNFACLEREVAMNSTANKAIVQRYFTEMVDKRSDNLIDELWSEDCIVHRPEIDVEGREAFRRAFSRVVEPYSELRTTIYNIIAESDLVVCRLSHRVVHLLRFSVKED